VIEHNLDVIKTADWIVDLGPEGGDEGGYIIAEGTPEAVSRMPQSCTGAFLKRLLGGAAEDGAVTAVACEPPQVVPAPVGAGASEA
jgi:excinuclease ABC subunit A